MTEDAIVVEDEEIINTENEEVLEDENTNENIYEETEENNLSNNDLTEISNTISSIKIDLTDEDKEKYTAKVPTPEKKKPGRQAKAKKDSPTPTEVHYQMTDEEIASGIDQETKDLYMEFSSFLEDKTEIKSDTGTKETIPTGIDLLDVVLGGGFTIGAMEVIVGDPGSGKSMIAMQAMGSAQRKYNGNILVSMLDSEEATTTVRLANLGVKNPKIKPYNDITVEKVFKFLEGICLYKEMKGIIDTPSIVLWDSVANTLSQREREAEDVNSVIGYKGRLLSLLIPKYVAKLSAYNICLITINQLRDQIQIGPMAPARELKFMRNGKTMPGGNTLKFNAFHLLEMKVKEVVTREKFGADGYFAEVKCVKNKLFPPNIKIPIFGNFVTGFSNDWTNYKLLVDNKRLITGSWNYLEDFPTVKMRTKDFIEVYSKNKEFKEAFDANVKETLETEYVKKYNTVN